MSRLVVVSNRVAPPDDKTASAGGLAVGVLGALKSTGGLWFGWSGETGDENAPLQTTSRGNISWATFNLSEADHELYYNQFSNAVLWPAFHYRLDLVNYQREAWEGYQRVNALIADKLVPLLEADDILWIHDYHLLPLAAELRRRGVKHRIGFSCISRSQPRRFLPHYLPTLNCWNRWLTTICWAFRPGATARRFLIVLPGRRRSSLRAICTRPGVKSSARRCIR